MKRLYVVALCLTILLGGLISASSAYADGLNDDGSANYELHFVAAGKKYGLNPNFIKAVAYAESGISQPSPICNSNGYCGIMQISQRLGSDVYGIPANNISEGARHLRYCLKETDDNYIEALVCYNAGIGRVYQIKQGRLRSHSVTRNIPWVGTQTGRTPAWTACKAGGYNDVCGYVHKILDRYNWIQKRHPYSNPSGTGYSDQQFEADRQKYYQLLNHRITFAAPAADVPQRQIDWSRVLALFAACWLTLKIRRRKRAKNTPLKEEV